MASYNKEKYIRQQEETKEILSRMVEETAKNYQDNPEDLAELLAFRSRFRTYSFRNTALILRQNPGASFVASYEKFKEMGYQVRRGQKGMMVFVPVEVSFFQDPQTGKWVQLKQASPEQKLKIKRREIPLQVKTIFKIGHVFDISQTDCPQKDYPKFFHMGYPSALHATLYNAVEKYCTQTLHCPVYQKGMDSIVLHGYYDRQKNEIYINSQLEDTQRLSTLIHEMGHSILHRGSLEKATVSQIEFEADSLALMIEKHLGIETTSSRKRHLAEHYQVLAGDVDQTEKKLWLEPILSHVFSEYSNYIPKLDAVIEDSLFRELALQGTLKSPSPEEGLGDFFSTETSNTGADSQQNQPQAKLRGYFRSHSDEKNLEYHRDDGELEL